MASDRDLPTSIDTMMFGQPGSTAVHLVTAERPALIDAGAATTAEAVASAVGRRGTGSIEAVALTHIHFDHAGGTGDLLRRFPEATVYVPEKVARHLVDPSRLTEGVRSVWGDRTEELFGLPAPVPAERIVTVGDGDAIDLGDRTLRVVATPGHTRAHVAYLDESDGSLFCGDAMGISLPALDVMRPATPPADFSLEDSLTSIRRIRELGAERLYVAHFGRLPDGTEIACDRASEALERWWDLFVRERAEANGTEDLVRRMHCALEASIEPVRPAQRRRLETVNPTWLNVSGMTMAADRAQGA